MSQAKSVRLLSANGTAWLISDSDSPQPLEVPGLRVSTERHLEAKDKSCKPPQLQVRYTDTVSKIS